MRAFLIGVVLAGLASSSAQDSNTAPTTSHSKKVPKPFLGGWSFSTESSEFVGATLFTATVKSTGRIAGYLGQVVQPDLQVSCATGNFLQAFDAANYAYKKTIIVLDAKVPLIQKDKIVLHRIKLDDSGIASFSGLPIGGRNSSMIVLEGIETKVILKGFRLSFEVPIFRGGEETKTEMTFSLFGLGEAAKRLGSQCGMTTP